MVKTAKLRGKLNSEEYQIAIGTAKEEVQLPKRKLSSSSIALPNHATEIIFCVLILVGCKRSPLRSQWKATTERSRRQ